MEDEENRDQNRDWDWDWDWDKEMGDGRAGDAHLGFLDVGPVRRTVERGAERA